MRVLALLAVGLVATVASADGLAPGEKSVPLTTSVILRGAEPGDVMVLLQDWRGDWKPVPLKADGPTPLALGGNRATLYLVPRAVSKQYLLKKELYAALDKQRPAGVAEILLRNKAVVRVGDKRARVDQLLVIRPGEEGKPPQVEAEESSDPVKKEPAASGRTVLAGVFLTLSVLLAGLVLSRRLRP